MYLSSRAAHVRNLLVAIANASITLIILLIAPMGLAAVIMNTLLVAIASFATATVADRVVLFLGGEPRRIKLGEGDRGSRIRRADPHDLDRS